MKTPGHRLPRVVAVIAPPAASAEELPGQRPSREEASAIARGVAPIFSRYVSAYDTEKYRPDVYENALRQFQQPATVTGETLRNALLWKYGHLGKPRIPSHHELLIQRVQHLWGGVANELPHESDAAFRKLRDKIGSRNRFITIAFLLHLLQPEAIPIIDQHNFRALNTLMTKARPEWRTKKKPSQFSDILLVVNFTREVLTAWAELGRRTVPDERQFDQFLMMYGKMLKQHHSDARAGAPDSAA